MTPGTRLLVAWFGTLSVLLLVAGLGIWSGPPDASGDARTGTIAPVRAGTRPANCGWRGWVLYAGGAAVSLTLGLRVERSRRRIPLGGTAEVLERRVAKRCREQIETAAGDQGPAVAGVLRDWINNNSDDRHAGCRR